MNKEDEKFFKEELKKIIKNIDNYEIVEWDNKLMVNKDLINCDDLYATTTVDNIITIKIKPIKNGGEDNED